MQSSQRTLSAPRRGEKNSHRKCAGNRDLGMANFLPRSLHSTAGAPNCGAEEKAGRSGRDDEKKAKAPALEGGRYKSASKLSIVLEPYIGVLQPSLSDGLRLTIFGGWEWGLGA